MKAPSLPSLSTSTTPVCARNQYLGPFKVMDLSAPWPLKSTLILILILIFPQSLFHQAINTLHNHLGTIVW